MPLEPSCLLPYLESKPVLVSFSGGPDSVALVSLLRQRLSSSDIILVYFNHQLRDSVETVDLPFIRSYSTQYGHPLYIRKLPVQTYSRIHKVSLEHAGRLLRLRHLAHFSRLFSVNFVFLGHHLDDFCETFLFQLARGTQMGKLGISETTPLTDSASLCRPLLLYSKAQILSYLSEQKESFVEDESNLDLSYSRNMIRHQIIPVLESLNSSFRTHFFSFSNSHFLQAQYIKSSVSSFIAQTEEGICVLLKDFLGLDSFLQKTLLYEMCHVFLSSLSLHQTPLFEISSRKIEVMQELSLLGKPGQALDLSESVRFVVKQGEISIFLVKG